MRIFLLILAAAAIAAVAVFLIFDQRGEDVQKLDLTERTNIPAAHGHPNVEKNVITFGFDLRSSPEEDARQYLPFLAYLEHETGHHFRLHFNTQTNRLSDDLAEGHVDLAAVGAVSYIRALEDGGAVPLVRGLNSEGRASYTSVIVVAPNGGIAALDDLRGMRFAFGSEDSTQGHLIPRIVLNEAGIALTDLASHEFTGSHQSCANAVISGSADACGMQDTLGLLLVKQGRLRVLHQSSEYPSSSIAAAIGMPPDVRKKIIRALLAFDPTGRHAATLYNWHRTEMPNGFARAEPGDYDNLRNSLEALGLMNSNLAQ